MNSFALPALSLWRREMIRFSRQLSRIIGIFGTPVIFWLFLGSGLSQYRPTGQDDVTYLIFFYPGTIALVLLFTSITSTISTIQDRQGGFLQGVLVSPAPRSSLVLGKLLGGSTLALIQGALLVALAPAVGMDLSLTSILLLAFTLFIFSFALTGLGLTFAWRHDSIQGFHAIMNLVLFPLWMLSGALFPVDQAPLWLRTLMKCNPLTYGVAAIREAFAGTTGVPLVVTIAFAMLMFVCPVWIARRAS